MSFALALAGGCSTSEAALDYHPAGEGGASTDGSSGGGALSTAGSGDAGTAGGGSTSSGGDSGGGTSGDGGSGGRPAPDIGMLPGCPDRLPTEWVFCQDFENVQDPAAVFFEYQDGKGSFELVNDRGASGSHCMEARYVEGVEGAGWISVSFGQNPIVLGALPQYDETEHFDEIYWRLRVKTEPSWPGLGPGSLTRATAFAQQDWGQAMVARLGTVDEAVVLTGDASSCVQGQSVTCQGYNDASALSSIGTLTGQTPLFSEGDAGKWHCVEAHVRLNTPGAPDGVFEFWVDGNLEASNDQLDWRGTWDAYGLNLVTVENLWPGGAPVSATRWIDDLVISTVPIGCK